MDTHFAEKTFDSGFSQIRERCRGISPLDAKLEKWQIDLLTGNSLAEWIDDFGSPLNVICPEPLVKNIEELNEVARQRDVDFRVYFARKANKCLALVDAAVSTGAGIDVASEQELTQVLNQGVSGRELICTAAVKNYRLLEICVNHEVTIAVDNPDELKQLLIITESLKQNANIALRLSGFLHEENKLHSRFGFDIAAIEQIVEHIIPDVEQSRIKIIGLHFHLDGYSLSQRIAAVAQSLPVLDHMRTSGHQISFLDIGGGLPMCYLENETQWEEFWVQHAEALLGRCEPITYRNHGLGLIAINNELHGKRNCYPYYQSPVRAVWLAGLLDAQFESSTIAAALRNRGVQLRCEPGRSVLDGCGMTVAQVQFRKQHPNGDWYIGLSMNRTQCRTTSDDFLVDPILIPKISINQTAYLKQTMEGYLVGAYCTESELISLRKFRFPAGVNIGDLIIFPNTAGYLMHFLESRSHQFPLANNLVVNRDDHESVQLDKIDRHPLGEMR